jgi:hypothetical protein
VQAGSDDEAEAASCIERVPLSALNVGQRLLHRGVENWAQILRMAKTSVGGSDIFSNFRVICPAVGCGELAVAASSTWLATHVTNT